MRSKRFAENRLDALLAVTRPLIPSSVKRSKPQSATETLPEITFRQLEVFSVTCKERSYANAALELHSTRANVKRVCQEFEAAVGRTLYEENPDRTLSPTPFAGGLLAQIGPLSRSLRKLGDGVRSLHEAGRILRFAAGGEFFRGGLFTEFLSTLEVSDIFRSCFVRIELKRFRTAILNAECDVYFGIGLGEADRLDIVDLGPVPWTILGNPKSKKALPDSPKKLDGSKWYIADSGESDVTKDLLNSFRDAGASGGSILPESKTSVMIADPDSIPKGSFLFVPNTSSSLAGREPGPWPTYRLTACLRRNHPYAELKSRLMEAAEEYGH